MKALDRTKPFGTINGDTEGRVYEQDNTFFCADGSPWQPKPAATLAAAPDEPADAPAKPKRGKAAPVDETPAAVDAELSAQMGAA